MRATTVRTAASVALAAGLLAGSASAALAHPGFAQEPTLPTDLTFAATDNVEYLGRFPEHSGTAGGRVVGDRFYVTDPRGVFVYDITDPALPMRLGMLPLPQTNLTGPALAQEDPDTDGKILLVDGVRTDATPTSSAISVALSQAAELQIVDVSDPTAMTVLASVPRVDHTWTCVTDPVLGAATPRSCDFAYGRSGHVIDLRDPANPVDAGSWRKGIGYGDRSNSPYTHDLTEVRPGLVMTAGGAASILLDTTDPLAAKELTRVDGADRFRSLGFHSGEWARGGLSDTLILGTEIAPNFQGQSNAGSDCQSDSPGGENAVVESYDATAVAAAVGRYEAGMTVQDAFADRPAFVLADAFDAGSRGIFLDGAAPSHTLYCAHWMELSPSFDDGGLMVVSYYDRGTRFVDVDQDGQMSEVGWMTAAESYSGSAQFITEDIVYVMDYRRGLEVLRLRTDEAGDLLPASGTYDNGGVDLVAAQSSVTLLGDGGSSAPVAPLVALAGVGLAATAVTRRRRATA